MPKMLKKQTVSLSGSLSGIAFQIIAIALTIIFAHINGAVKSHGVVNCHSSL